MYVTILRCLLLYMTSGSVCRSVYDVTQAGYSSDYDEAAEPLLHLERTLVHTWLPSRADGLDRVEGEVATNTT